MLSVGFDRVALTDKGLGHSCVGPGLSLFMTVLWIRIPVDSIDMDLVLLYPDP